MSEGPSFIGTADSAARVGATDGVVVQLSRRRGEPGLLGAPVVPVTAETGRQTPAAREAAPGRPLRARKIFPVPVLEDGRRPEESGRVYVTISPGETRVTVLDGEGGRRRSWVAIFGWADICELGVQVGDRRVPLEEQELIVRAMQGRVRLFGREVDTTAFIQEAASLLQVALEDILTRTVGSGARYDVIVLSAPGWMRGILSPSTAIRPHILTEINDDA